MNGLRVVIIMCVFMLTFSCVQLKKKKTNTHYNNVDTIFVCYALLHRVFCYFVLSPSTQVYPLLHVIFSSFQIPVLPKTKLFNGPLICFKLTRIDLLTTRQVRVDILIHFKMQVGIWFCRLLWKEAMHVMIIMILIFLCPSCYQKVELSQIWN